MSCEVKSCMFVRNKSIIKTNLSSIHCFQLKYEPSIQNIAFSSEKMFHLNQERNLHRSSTVYKWKTVQNCSKQICGGILMLEEKRRWTFSLEEHYDELWTLAGSDSLKLKRLNDGFVSYKHAAFWLHKMLIDGLEWCRLLVDYCDVFISCLDSHSDGTHSLQRIHWWASDGMLHFSKSLCVFIRSFAG